MHFSTGASLNLCINADPGHFAATGVVKALSIRVQVIYSTTASTF